MNQVRKNFIKDVKNVVAPEVLVTAVQLPTGAIEVITNASKIGAKIEYLMEAYDDNFALKVNPSVKIVGYMLV
jgi:hypothetical protein